MSAFLALPMQVLLLTPVKPSPAIIAMYKCALQAQHPNQTPGANNRIIIQCVPSLHTCRYCY